ncbi:MAG: molecular chaperone DnaK [Acidobacteria bacterium]|uniref:Chaperone protein DnaK n=1 Tax=Candidatus Polarisedimenticola svalbardensis TaxID=2886004 RepID=A0A8J7CE28_9BACT|nr:molecular chaperone DnaK [Candidatus Polarisedimenticola svalbardensis]
MGKVIGIDLGTTNCCVAVMEGAKPKVVVGKEGGRTTPSIVAFTGRGERLVGQLAKRQALTNPQNTIYAVKRLIGRKHDSGEVAKAKQIVPYEIVPSPNGDAWIKVRDKDYSPPEISAFVLLRLKEMAEDYLGAEVTEAVVTVPAYFDDSQRQATKDAGRISGLNVLRIVNEPTAAALAHGMDEGTANRTIAIYDLGGGTFDISILQLHDGVFEVKSTSGDTFLGGEDFDQRVVDWLLGQFETETGIDLRSDRLALQRLKEAAEKAKCELSSENSAEINLPFISADESGARHLHTSLDRETFEQLVEDLVERTRKPCEEALKMAGMTPDMVNEILLVGGQTRTPRVAAVVQEIFGQEPDNRINPDEVVGVGAAIQAGIIKGDVKDLVLLDVTPLSLGIETRGGMFTKIIERNATIPTRKSRTFTTVTDNQTKVKVHVLQGEREIAAHNKALGEFELVGIPPAPKGVPQVEVTFDIDSNGIVNVHARDMATNREQKIIVTPSGGLNEDEIITIIEDAKVHADEDRRKAEYIRTRSRLEGMVDSNQKTFNEFGAMLSPENQEIVRTILENSKKAVESGSNDRCYEALEKLAEVGVILSEVILYDPGAISADPDEPASDKAGSAEEA